MQRASSIQYPDVCQTTAWEVVSSSEPRRLRNLEADEIWDLSLQEAIYIALSNSRIIRSSATFLSPGNPLLARPEGAPSIFDPALQATGTLFGYRGVEAALSEFDAQFTTSMIWGKNETIQNNLFQSGGIAPGGTLQEDTAAFNSGLTKRFATGGQLGISHRWNYSLNNANRLFPSYYEGNVRADFRQPLLAGAGVEYTRIAGPISENIQGVTGVQQGVLIARINNDISLADFELAVHMLLRDVEQTYWRLVLAYRQFHTYALARDRIMEMWRVVDARLEAGAPGAGRLPEAELRDSYVQQVTAAENALDQVYAVEAELRRLLALPVNDGRVIRPADEPVTAEVLPDWTTSLGNALAYRPELRRQKWSIKSLQFQLDAAHNLNRPRLDLVASAQVNGFGDRLLGPSDDGITGSNLGSAYDRLLANKQNGWNLGVEYSTPIGRRYAHAQVRNLELQLAKARVALHQQEVEVSHELAAAFRDVDRTYLAMRSAYNRISAAQDRLDAILDRRLPGDLSLDPVLRAHESLLHAELQYLAAISEYNTAITEWHFRSARLLEVDRVTLAEGPWCSAARVDAALRHQHRAHSFDAPWKETVPPEFSADVPQGTIQLPAVPGSLPQE